MKKIYESTRILDKNAISNYDLSEDILMENAACALEQAVKKSLTNKTEFLVTILCGSGDNGGDGYTLARRLTLDEYDNKKINVQVYAVKDAKTEGCIKQKNRCQKANVKINNYIDLSCKDEFEKSDIIVDCIFGSGFYGEMDLRIKNLIEYVNSLSCIKIACDIPSGLKFRADITVTMGALKTQLYLDSAKDVCGTILVANLGISQKLFESFSEDKQSQFFLLEEKDLILPIRTNQNCHKGSFGHVCVVSGEKVGASVISANAALSFGSGLVTMLQLDKNDLTRDILDVNQYSEKTFDKDFNKSVLQDVAATAFELMYSTIVPQNTSVICGGMGLGSKNTTLFFDLIEKYPQLPVCIDADLFYDSQIVEFLKKRSQYDKIDVVSSVVLTPHPKEFANLLKLCQIFNEDNKEYTVTEIIQNKFEIVKKFCMKFPKVVLILKGANVLIGYAEKKGDFNVSYEYNHQAILDCKIYVNPYGQSSLAKGGSGDVLAGLVASLLAQKYTPLQSAICASLSHAFASKNVQVNNYGMTPFDLIKAIKTL